MKNNFTLLNSMLRSSAAFSLVLLMAAGSTSAQVNRFGALAGRSGGSGAVIISPTHCVSVNMLTNTHITDTQATLSWNPSITADGFRIIYTNMSTGSTAVATLPAGTSSYSLNGLAPAAQYKWYVISLCASGNHISSLMKFSTLAPVTPRLQSGINTIHNININNVSFCPTIGNVVMLDMEYDKAILTFSRTNSYDSICVRYTPSGTTNFKIVSISGTPNSGRFILTGLTGQTSYDIDVKTYCNNTYSAYSAPITVTTFPEPPPRLMNSDKANNKFEITPNPASRETNISFNCENSGLVYLEVFDITGKKIFKTVIEAADGNNDFKFDLSKFFKGIYILKMNGNNISSVQRMIVQ